MLSSDIIIKGAREHNLRDIDLVLPRNKLICFTGVSGSGKSSLAFDTLYAEGQRRYVESLSSYARQFLGQMPKPDVEWISGLSPSISISQKSAGNNPRSTVGTITEIYDYLRVLMARVGTPHCPSCGGLIAAQSREQIIEQILEIPEGTKLLILAPLIRGQKGEYRDLCDDLRKQGFARARIDGQVVSLADDLRLDRHMRHDIEVVIDRLSVRSGIRPRLAEAVDAALKIGGGNLITQEAAVDEESKTSPRTGKSHSRSATTKPASRDQLFSVDHACAACRLSFDAPSPQLFSFNSPQGMCLECDGLGHAFTFDVGLLVPDDSLSVKQGCIVQLGWKQLGRYRRATYEGVASTVERIHELPAGTMLQTAWRDLGKPLQDAWLWGTGDENVTITWRGGNSPVKFGIQFDGIIPQLLARYRSARSPILIAELERFMRTMECPECGGQRLNRQARFVRIRTARPNFDPPAKSLPEICRLSIAEAQQYFAELHLTRTQQIVAAEALKEIRGRLGFLTNVGLDYLTLDRTAPTLSGGESQRIRLAGQVGCGLVGVLYILDEPSIGLHPRDNERLLSTLTRLRDVGNTVVVVEHDEDTMRCADHIVDFGPGPGVRGGHVVATGNLKDIQRAEGSVTGHFLAGKRKIQVPTTRRSGSGHSLNVIRAAHNNLKGIDVRIPLGKLVCITGVSGSGKSSLVNDILIETLRRDLNGGEGEPGTHERIEGLEHLDKMIAIDQTPIGRTPRSNPSTYIKVFDDIRRLFTQLPESKQRGYKPGRFSFNVAGGRCEACEGNGSNKLEMDFLADIWVVCPVCEGHRFNRETLGVKYKGASIAEVLEMDVQQALTHFANIPPIQHKLQTLHDVGLDYLKLGQPSPTLSGGEAQRVKLARELVKKSTGKTLYLLDEPTTGLHFADIHLLLDVLHGFVDAGNTVLVVEHNLDVIKTADWIIDLGPEGGAGGGQIVAEGTPEQLIDLPSSYTGKALASFLRPRPTAAKPRAAAARRTDGAASSLATHIVVRGARQHNLKNVDVRIPREQMSVFCGPSGSGKTSLAMDTIYAEGQRRYVESLSSYARQFVSQMQKPQLEHIEGLSPAIAIEQQNLGSTPRSTVGTSTEIYDYLRVLLARLGAPFCPDCDRPIGTQTVDQVVDKIMALSGSRIHMLAPVQIEVGQKYETLWDELRRAGFARVRVDGVTHSLEHPPEIDRRRRHEVAVVMDRVQVRTDIRSRIAESAEAALAFGKGLMQVAIEQPKLDERHWELRKYNQQLACDQCGRSFEPMTPHNFSFNSPLGWCPECEGLGTQTGAHPAALLEDPQASLSDGALLLWPNLDQAMSQRMLEVFSSDTGIPLDVPFQRLSARQRRVVFHGTGDRWFSVHRTNSPGKSELPWFRFQFKGMYPALEESARLTPHLRFRLNYLVGEIECAACGGSRLRDDAAAVRCKGQSMDDLCRLPLAELQRILEGWKLDAREKKIAGELLREIKSRVKFLNDVGLEYLTLSRTGASLSGGEAQRIRLASQLGSGLCGVLYVLDEPTVGLHPQDNLRLLKALHGLRDLGNTLLIVEHDREVIAGSDALFDFGPRAGKHGGLVVASGTPRQVQQRTKSVTGPYLSGKKSIPVPAVRRQVDQTTNKLVVRGARHHNLKNIDVTIPLERLVTVTGPSGSGKSSLIDDILHAALAARLHRAATVAGTHDGIDGIEFINKVIRVDQQPLGNSPTSNPATYTKAFDVIRELFAQLPESKLRGYTSRRFSFNVPGGRCESCEGNGQLCIEMHFLPDVWVECETCRGRRYNQETLEVRYHGKSIADVLEMTCDEAAVLFENIPKIRRIIETLQSVGLGYVALGQPAPTLSGGEAQRVKLAAELARPDTGQTLYLLDEPTTGLHFDDLARLLEVLQRLVDLGNSVVVIEHNLDVIKSADWVIDMGPGAGQQGGTIVAEGAPEQITEPVAGPDRPGKSTRRAKRITLSATGVALAPVLASSPRKPRAVFDPQAVETERTGDLEIPDVGRETRMPWEVDGHRWHTQDRVGRRGEPCGWDGRILDEVERRIQATGKFAPTNWNSRTIVEITGPTKSDGWFMHAITGEAWLLKLKFRVANRTFQREALQKRLPLEPLNSMDHLPIYGNEPRVKCKSLRGPWQELELRLHAWEEADRPEFWSILDEAIAGFQKMMARVIENPEDLMPWKKLGQRWHFSRKGFPPGKPIAWEQKVLEEICELLHETAGEGQFLWNNQQVVHLYVKEQKEPWASIWTKRPQELSLVLTGPKGAATLGRVSELGHDRELDASDRNRDVVRIAFRDYDDIQHGDLQKFLSEHRNSLGA